MKIMVLVVCAALSLFGSSSWILSQLNIVAERAHLSHARGVAEVVGRARSAYVKNHHKHGPSTKIETARVRIYSPYPFPDNANGGLHDDFMRRAWQELSAGKSREAIEWAPGIALRYAVAERMTRSCVECHNSHPNTLKDDWKIGDVAGVIEVSLHH